VYDSLSVQHYRLFERLSVSLSPVTLISGKNNTGKTALIESLFLHASGPRAAHNALAALNAARGIQIILSGKQDEQTVWDPFFKDYRNSKPIRIDGRFDGKQSTVEIAKIGESFINPSATLPVTTSTSSSQNYSQSIRVSTIHDGVSQDYTQTVTQQTFAQPSIGSVSLQVGGQSLQLIPSAQPFISANFLAGRLKALQPDIAQRYSDLRFLNRQDDLYRALKAIDPRVRSVELLARDGQSTLHLDVEGQLMPLSQFGEGMGTVADIISSIYDREVRVVFIDEIENGIHYSVLESLWWNIKRAARATQTQVIATTHSRECMEAAQAAFSKDARDMLSLVRLARKPGDASEIVATSYDFNELDTALDLNLDVR